MVNTHNTHNTHDHLDYAPQPPWFRRRRTRRWALVCLVAFAGLLSPLWAPPLWRRAQILQLQRQCLTYAAPADSVVYETGGDPSAHADDPGLRVATVGDSAAVVRYRPVDAWERFYRLSTAQGRKSGAVAFMHERQTPAGQRLLVVVDIYPSLFAGDPPFRMIHLCTPARWFSSPRFVAFSVVPNDASWDAALRSPRLQVFAGQPDPSDPTHFTIPYSAAGQPGTIHGYLRDDGRVELTARQGR